MQKVSYGDTVRVHYEGFLKDGTMFDSSLERGPLEFSIGNSQVIVGFEKGVLGMSPGDKQTINIPAAEAYGDYRKELLLTVDRGKLPGSLNPEIGMQLQVPSHGGRPANVVITDLDAKTVTFDGNHPLAGKDLRFEVELLEILS